jgi:hypothetical protein
MATIPDEKLTELRQVLANRLNTTRWSKLQINAALQACENWFGQPAAQSAMNDAINSAVSDISLTAAERCEIKRAWLQWRAEEVE